MSPESEVKNQESLADKQREKETRPKYKISGKYILPETKTKNNKNKRIVRKEKDARKVHCAIKDFVEKYVK